MSEELENELPPETPEPEQKSGFVLTERLKAVAQGLDPDNLPEEEDTDVDEPVDEIEGDEAVAPEKSEPTSWIQDADRQRAQSYGLDPEDLDAYSSREDFGKALRAIDKAFSRLNPAQPAPAEVDEVEEVEAEDADQKIVNGKINPAYYEKRSDEYDEDYILTIKNQRALQDRLDQFESSAKEAEEQQREAEVQYRLAEFHRTVDSFSSNYGKSVDESGQVVPLSPQDAERRWKLMDAARLHLDHIHNSQRLAGLQPSTPPLPHLLKQAEQIAFPEEVLKRAKEEAVKEREVELKKIAKQSQRRRPVATTASVSAAHRGTPPEDPYTTEAIMRHPNVEAWRRRREERTGAV
jgi:hypothetical protein